MNADATVRSLGSIERKGHEALCKRHCRLVTAVRWAIALTIAGLFCLNVAINARAQSSGFNPQYPPRATAVAAVSSGADTTTATATIPAAPGQTSYVCGFTVSGLGATAATTVTVTVGTLPTAGTSFSYPYTFALGAGVTNTMLQ